MKKIKTFSALLMLVMAISVFAVPAFASGTDEAAVTTEESAAAAEEAAPAVQQEASETPTDQGDTAADDAAVRQPQGDDASVPYTPLPEPTHRRRRCSVCWLILCSIVALAVGYWLGSEYPIGYVMQQLTRRHRNVVVVNPSEVPQQAQDAAASAQPRQNEPAAQEASSAKQTEGMQSDKTDFADAGLTLSFAFVRHFNAVIERISKQVHNRIANLVDNRAVEFGVLAFDCQVDFLIEFFGNVANHARETVKDLADGNHADFHNDILKVGSNPVHLFKCFSKFRKSVSLSDLFKTNFIDDKLSH